MTEANEQHEPSYYEIALTNRQVMAAFVILLLCVLGAFFSGVWVGRGGRTDRHAASSAAQAQATPPGQPMQELQFFTPKTDKPAEKPAEKPAASSTPGTSLAADLGKPADASPSSTADQDEVAPSGASGVSEPAPLPPTAKPTAPAVSERPTATASATTGATGPGAKPSSPAATSAAATSGSTAPAAPSTAAAKPAAAPAHTPELAPGEMVVQVFSSSDGEQAKKTVQRVNKGGFKAYLSPLQVGTQTMYRVRIGPFTDRASAQKVADQVRKRFKLDTWITR